MTVSPSKAKYLADKTASETEKTLTSKGRTPGATEEQLIYANILGNGRKIGLAGIIVAFVIYLSGIVSPKMPLSNVPKYWHLPSGEFMKTVGLQPGWSWVGMYHYGDMLNFFGVAILGVISIVCYLAIVPKLMRKKDITYVAIALLEVVVLLFAASGIVHIGE